MEFAASIWFKKIMILYIPLVHILTKNNLVYLLYEMMFFQLLNSQEIPVSQTTNQQITMFYQPTTTVQPPSAQLDNLLLQNSLINPSGQHFLSL